MEKTQIELLREKLTALNKEREEIILEKGLAARDNNDLRENFAYDYWSEKERVATARIHALSKEIEEIYTSSRSDKKNSFRK